ncbi:MAG: glucosaminidase domain-containing protein [Ktedonobacteraceae bacterium]|nr:glucosaminidase domain-containing protein [Ktedonobacteraceae bacterium]
MSFKKLCLFYGFLLLVISIVAASIGLFKVTPLPGGGTLTSRQLFATIDESVSNITSAPHLSAPHLEMILRAYHSPLVGLGQYIYDEGRRYQIDSDHAMAFWLHESTLGTRGEATGTFSPGNLRCVKGRPCVDQQRGGYAQFSSWKDGIDRWYSLLHFGYVQGDITKPIVGHACTTLEQIIHVYAPSSDANDEQAYVNAVIDAVTQWRAGKMVIA